MTPDVHSDFLAALFASSFVTKASRPWTIDQR
jgi:hypothetical protein